MPTYNLFLNTKNSVNGSNVFQYTFPNGFELPQGSEIAINSVNIPYSWINVSSTLGNNTFSYYISGNATAYTVTLSNGFYLASDISNALQSAMKANGHYWYQTGTTTQPFIGSITGTTLSISASTPVSLAIGTTISGSGITSVTVTAAASSSTYTLSASQTAVNNILLTATSPANNNLIQPTIIYPLSISTFYPLYTNGITSVTIPTSANIASTFGSGYIASSSWAGGYPATASYAYIVFPLTNSTTTTIANILGFTSSGTTQYPSSSPSPSASSNTYGNSLSATPSFPPKGSQVNGIIVRCSLIENPVSGIGLSDIMDFIPITSSYGSNITYLPISDNAVKVKPGKHQFLTITFNDDSFNNLQMLDTNILLSLIIRTPTK